MTVRLVVSTVVMAASVLYVASAQTAAPAKQPADAALAALVTELRAIRQDLAEAGQRSLRFQLLLARLQLQEQRIGHLDRQRADIVKSLMDAQTMTAMFSDQFGRMAKDCERPTISTEESQACAGQLELLKGTVATHQGREQQLRMQEQELSQAIATEQGRWAEFSARLDELERALTRPR